MSIQPILHHLGHTLIRASAGTGKTHALTTRYAQWVAAGVEPQQIIAITFTRRAAAELRTRIRTALIMQGASEAEMAQLATAPITNFHGLALSLCEEFWPGGIGEGAQHVLGESGEDKQLFTESCESAWFAGSPKVAAALGILSPWMRIDGSLMAQLWDAIGLARESAEPVTEALFGRYDAQSLGAAAQTQLEALREHILAHQDDLTTPAGLRAISHLRATPVPIFAEGAPELAAWQKGWRAMFAPINRKGRMGQVVDAETLGSVPKLLESVEAESHAQAMVPALFVLTETAWRAYSQAKAARHAIDFADLIERAIDILQHNAEAYRLVRARTRAVLVDEAQDTNALQRRLVRLLAGLEDTKEQQAPAATTVVGDWKQAIYTFRGADPQNFSRFADDLAALGGAQESLVTSYRSVAPLVSSINALGEHLFGEPYEALQPQVVLPSGAQAADAYHGASNDGMHWLAVSRTDGGRLTLADDAWATAQHAAKLIRTGTEPRDIAVLLAHVRGPAPTYLQAFAAAGVPLIASGTGDLLQQPHVVELLALCRWLTDDSATGELDGAIALSSPLFACDDDALYHLLGPEGRAHNRMQALRDGDAAALAKGAAVKLAPQLLHACAILPKLIAWAGHLPMTEMLEHLDITLHIRALYGTEHAGCAQRRADFDALCELAQVAERRGYGAVADCISHLAWRKAQGFITAQGEHAQSNQQAVLLSSVHGSKGLQYPIVILPALERRGQQFSGTLLFQRELGMAFALQAGRERLRPKRFLDATAAITAAAQAELRRLAYVAVTRAKKQVVFVGPPPEQCRNTGFAGIIGPWAAGAGHAVKLHPVEVPIERPTLTFEPSLWRPASAAVAQQAIGALQDVVAPLPMVPKHAGATTTALQLSVSELLNAWHHHHEAPVAHATTGADPAIAAHAAGDAGINLNMLTAQDTGILAHAILGRMDEVKRFPSHAAFIDAVMRHLGHSQNTPQLQQVACHVADTLASPIGQRLLAAPPGARRFEVDFLWHGTAAGHPIALRGQVDALLQEGERLTLIDFKHSSPSRGAKRYQQQLQIYVWALRSLYGAHALCEAHILWLESPRVNAAVPIDEAACAWVPEALEAWARAAHPTQGTAHGA